MTESTKIGRREFTLTSALAMLAGTTITLTGCDSDSPTAPTDTTPDGVSVSISNNHGHEAEITSGQLTAGDMLTLNIQGTSSHPHTVDLSMTQVQAIAAGGSVSVTSTTDAGHAHGVTFSG